MIFHTTNPTTGTHIAEYAAHTPAQIGSAVVRAHDAFANWRALPFATRADRLRTLATLLRRDSRALAELAAAEMGKPVREGLGEVEKCAWNCEHYAEHAERLLSPVAIPSDASRSGVRYEPLGVILNVMPWNFPFWQVVRQAAPTLMAGNVVLLKHAPNVLGCASRLADLFAEAGMGDGVFTNLVADVDVVKRLLEDDRVRGVALTGSERAGRAVGALAGANIKPCVLELGGSDPFVVLADADLDLTVAGGVLSRYLNSGQSCIAAKRFVVVREIAEAFLDRFVAAVAALRVGDPLDDATQVGPIARDDLRDALHDQVRRSVAMGARAIVGGDALPGPGFFYAPTVLLDAAPGMPAFDEELFGPVATVTIARDEDEALSLAAHTRFGLGASIWTARGDVDALVSRLDAGCVAVNGIVKSDPRLPFGGTRVSGLGRELGRDGLVAFTNAKTVWVR